jgi:hypothetical protein
MVARIDAEDYVRKYIHSGEAAASAPSLNYSRSYFRDIFQKIIHTTLEFPLHIIASQLWHLEEKRDCHGNKKRPLIE